MLFNSVVVEVYSIKRGIVMVNLIILGKIIWMVCEMFIVDKVLIFLVICMILIWVVIVELECLVISMVIRIGFNL